MCVLKMLYNIFDIRILINLLPSPISNTIIGDFGLVDRVISQRIDQSKKKQDYLYHIIFQFVGVISHE